MPLPVLPSKLVWERISVEFDYSGEFQLNESITTWEVSVSVQTGDDLNPEDMLATRRALNGLKVYQWIINGIPGVVYNLKGVAVSSLGRTYKLERTLAVLPCSQVIPPLFGVVYTTTVYPDELLESLDFNVTILSGATETPPADYLDFSVSILSGSLREPLITYTWPPEGLNNLAVPVSGSLVTPLITYSSWPAEGLNNIAVPTNGTLVQILITYSNWPAEGLNNLALPTGGSLV